MVDRALWKPFGEVYLEDNGQAAATIIVKEHCVAVRPAANTLFSGTSHTPRGGRSLACGVGSCMLF